MKILPIEQKHMQNKTFRKNEDYLNYYDDYGTYYNQISLKDAFISSTIISAIGIAGTLFIANQEKLSKLVGMTTSRIKNKLQSYNKKINFLA